MKIFKFIAKILTNIMFVCSLAIFAVYGYLHFTEKEFRLVQSGSMEPALETKGDANIYSDGISTTEENYYGKTVSSFPMLGKLYILFKSQRGIVLWVTFVVVLFLVNTFFDEYESD